MLKLQSLPTWLVWLCLVLILAVAVVAGYYVCRMAQEETGAPSDRVTAPVVQPPAAPPAR